MGYQSKQKFPHRFTPNSDGKPRALTHTLVRAVFSRMEVSSRKVRICLARGLNGMCTRYLSSVVEAIKDHASNFLACPGAQVYWWLRCRGCLAEDLNQLICHCFMLDQQQRVTKLE
jgi:hypothetical protein